MSLSVADRQGARWIRLERPPVNVLDLPAIAALDGALTEAASRRDLKAVVLASGLPGVFSAGVEVRDHVRERVPAMLAAFHGLFHRLEALPQATIAVVEGTCLGGGCELAVFCDIVLATPSAVFGQPEIEVGCFPPLAAVLLPRVAPRAAAELVLTGRRITAEEAARAGLVSRVVPDARAEAEHVVARLHAQSGAVLTVARRAVRQGGLGSLAEALARSEALYLEDLLATSDMDEGVRAFLEKRTPRWRDA
jgi:cyclohexa-1,5-dienecarbonyl-CoA hydratase